MLGRFDNFPIFVHKTKTFKINAPSGRAQQNVIEALHGLNGKEISSSGTFDGIDAGLKVIFEVGVADGVNFNYLDDLELKRCLNHLKGGGDFKVLDFFFVNRYYKVDNKRRMKPLKFDYQLIRFEFSNKNLIIKVYHERGPRRIQLEELIDFLAKQIL